MKPEIVDGHLLQKTFLYKSLDLKGQSTTSTFCSYDKALTLLGQALGLQMCGSSHTPGLYGPCSFDILCSFPHKFLYRHL